MAKIKLSANTFRTIPEGEQIFKITGADYDERFGKLVVDLVTADGLKHNETYRLIGSNGEVNEGARKAFSYFARVAIQDPNANEIDPEELVGCFIMCDVEHDVQPNRNDPTKNVTFIHLKNYRTANGFDVDPLDLD